MPSVARWTSFIEEDIEADACLVSEAISEVADLTLFLASSAPDLTSDVSTLNLTFNSSVAINGLAFYQGEDCVVVHSCQFVNHQHQEGRRHLVKSFVKCKIEFGHGQIH
jgi:hypothetical protein